VSAMTAVIPMPGVRLVTARRMPLERREQLLAWLAEHALDLPAEVVTLGYHAWSHDDLHGPALDAAWLAYVRCRALADAADAGVLDCDTACGDCGHRLASECGCSCCPAPGEIEHQDAADALNLLARGCGINHNGGTR